MDKIKNYRSIDQNDYTVRVMKAFNEHLPPDGRENFIQHLQSLHTDEEVRDHAKSLVTGLLTPMRTIRSTPTISPRPGMEESIKDVSSQSGGPLTRGASLKQHCLSRDDHRCVVTKHVDELYTDLNDANAVRSYVECAHIIPFSLAKWKNDKEERAKAAIWVHLIRYFPAIESKVNFTRDNINDTHNAMILSLELNRSFGRFDFTFEETRVPHRYRLKNYRPQLLRNLPRTTTLSAHDLDYALPHPELLKIHAAIAQIFHASGLAKHIDKSFQDLTETSVMAKDGSTDISSILDTSSLGVLSSLA